MRALKLHAAAESKSELSFSRAHTVPLSVSCELMELSVWEGLQLKIADFFFSHLKRKE